MSTQSVPITTEELYTILRDAKNEYATNKGVPVESLTEDDCWWADVYNVPWEKGRAAGGCIFFNPEITRKDGSKTGLRKVTFKGEVHSGQIGPKTAEEAARMNSETRNENFKVSVRDKGIQIHFRKYSKEVETEDDGITVKKDANGNPIYPGPDDTSITFLAAELLQQAFEGEVHRAHAQGLWITQDESTKAKKEKRVIPKSVPVASNSKVSSCVRYYVSDNSKKNAGEELPNPGFRCTIKEDKDNGHLETVFHDMDKPFTVEIGGVERTRFEAAKVDGEPITGYNVHKWLTSRSLHDGLLDWGSICFSNLAISQPHKVVILVTKQRERFNANVDDIYDMYDDAAPPAPAKQADAPPAAAAAQPPDEGDVNDLIGDLGV